MSWSADYEERKTREIVENALDSRAAEDYCRGYRPSVETPVSGPAPKWSDQLGPPLWATWAVPAVTLAESYFSPYVPAKLSLVDPVFGPPSLDRTPGQVDPWAKRSIYCRT